MLFGAFTYGGVWGGTQPIVELERRLGHRLDIVHWFARIEEPFDTRLLAAAAADGRRPMVTLEMTSWSLDSVADGRHDATLRHWARAVRSHGDRVYLRPWPEMNGSWTPWSGDPAAFVSAWRVILITRVASVVTARDCTERGCGAPYSGGGSSSGAPGTFGAFGLFRAEGADGAV